MNLYFPSSLANNVKILLIRRTLQEVTTLLTKLPTMTTTTNISQKDSSLILCIYVVHTLKEHARSRNYK